MAELANREEFENRLARRLGKVYGNRRQELLRMLGNPPNFDRLPASWWDDVRREIEEEYLAILILLIIAVGSLHGVDLGGRSRLLAMQRATQEAGAAVGRKRDQLDRRRAEWELRDAEGKDPPTKDKVQDAVTKVFGPRTAEGEAVSTVSRGQIDGIDASRTEINNTGRGRIELFWRHTNVRPPGHSRASVDPCPICTPREGKPEPEWGGLRPGEAHLHCDCFAETVLIDPDGGRTIIKGPDDLPDDDEFPGVEFASTN